MNYETYIKLGFERIDMSDAVEFKRTGYHGYALEKKLNDRVMVGTSSGELDKPKLYIKKLSGETWHIMPISTEAVKALFAKKSNIDYMFNAA